MESNLSIGLMLYQARIARDMLISQVARAINIRPTILDALEKNEFEKIGAIVYVRGYLKRYAIFLELNYEELDAELKKIQQNSEPVILVMPRKKQIPYLKYYGIALMFIFIGAGYHYWLKYETVSSEPVFSPIESFDKINSKPDAQITDLKNQVNDVQLVESSNLESSNVSKQENLSAVTNINEKDNSKGRDPEVFTKTPSLNASSSIAENLELGIDNSPSDANDAPQMNTNNGVGSSGESKLVIVVNGDNWTEIRDVAGKKLFSGILATGQTHVTVGLAPFSIKFGNVQTVVSMSYNGIEVAQNLIKVNATATVHRMIVGEKL